MAAAAIPGAERVPDRRAAARTRAAARPPPRGCGTPGARLGGRGRRLLRRGDRLDLILLLFVIPRRGRDGGAGKLDVVVVEVLPAVAHGLRFVPQGASVGVRGGSGRAVRKRRAVSSSLEFEQGKI